VTVNRQPSRASRASSSVGSCGTLTARKARPSCNRRRMVEGRLALDELLGRPVAAVDEQHAAAGLQAVRDERPEGFEPLERHVREPEAEEDDVVPAVRPPAEQVGPDEPHAVVPAHALRGDEIISRDASTAVTLVAYRITCGVHVLGPQASSSTSPSGRKASSAACSSSPPTTEIA
jgi:hypothetical protein